MKKRIGILLALLLALACTQAFAIGTHAVGTQMEPLNRVVVSNGASSNDTSFVTWLTPPTKVSATTVNARVYLTWDKIENASYYNIYEKWNGTWSRLDSTTLRSIEFDADDGEHTYGVSSVAVGSSGALYESKNVRKVEVLVLDGSDKPTADADIQELTLTGTSNQTYNLVVYDNTYLHLKTDSLTWIVNQNGTVVQPEMDSDFLLYTSLGNNLYLRANKHVTDGAGELVIGTYNYSTQTLDGVQYYKVGSLRAYFTLKLTYKSGKAPKDDPEDQDLIVVNGGNYKIQDGEASYLGPTYWGTTEVKIPDALSIGSYTVKVTSIAAKALKGNSTVKKVTIGANVRTVGKYAFQDCTKLKTVSGGRGITTIQMYAFKGCKVLTKITLYEKVKSIGKYAFQNCKKLKYIALLTTQLTTSRVGTGAFKSIYYKATFTCPEGKKKAYATLMRKRGASTTARFN